MPSSVVVSVESSSTSSAGTVPETSRTTNMVLKISLCRRKNEFYTLEVDAVIGYSYALHSTDCPETDRVDKIFDQVTGGASKVKVTGC